MHICYPTKAERERGRGPPSDTGLDPCNHTTPMIGAVGVWNAADAWLSAENLIGISAAVSMPCSQHPNSDATLIPIRRLFLQSLVTPPHGAIHVFRSCLSLAWCWMVLGDAGLGGSRANWGLGPTFPGPAPPGDGDGEDNDDDEDDDDDDNNDNDDDDDSGRPWLWLWL